VPNPDPDLRPDERRPVEQPDLGRIIMDTLVAHAAHGATAIEHTSNLVPAIERAFLLIPRTQLEPGTVEYLVPRDLADDSPAVASYHAHQMHNAVAASVAEGLLIVTRPVLEEADEETRRAHTRAFIEDARLFRLSATGWRIPAPAPAPAIDLASDDTCPHCGALLARCMLVPCPTRQTGAT